MFVERVSFLFDVRTLLLCSFRNVILGLIWGILKWWIQIRRNLLRN